MSAIFRAPFTQLPEAFIPLKGRSACLSREKDIIDDLFGRLLAKTFLREYVDYSRLKPLSKPDFIKDKDRPFLIVNGTVHFRRPDSFDISQECFEMTLMYCADRGR